MLGRHREASLARDTADLDHERKVPLAKVESCPLAPSKVCRDRS
jgi:hypothetical protein